MVFVLIKTPVSWAQQGPGMWGVSVGGRGAEGRGVSVSQVSDCCGTVQYLKFVPIIYY